MGSTQISQPTPPAAPSVQDSASAYAQSLPTIYAAQMQYQPQFEQQNLDLTKQFAPQYKAIQDALYPELSKLDTSLTNQAQAGINGDLPDYLKSKYQDQFRAEVGDQNGSGIAGDYVSRNMLAAGEQYKQNSQNLALTLTGRQPLYQANQMQPAYNATQNYNYGTTSSFQGTGYGNYSNAYSNMYSANGQYQLGMNQLTQKYIAAGVGAAASVIPH